MTLGKRLGTFTTEELDSLQEDKTITPPDAGLLKTAAEADRFSLIIESALETIDACKDESINQKLLETARAMLKDLYNDDLQKSYDFDVDQLPEGRWSPLYPSAALIVGLALLVGCAIAYHFIIDPLLPHDPSLIELLAVMGIGVGAGLTGVTPALALASWSRSGLAEKVADSMDIREKSTLDVVKEARKLHQDSEETAKNSEAISDNTEATNLSYFAVFSNPSQKKGVRAVNENHPAVQPAVRPSF